MLLYMCFVYLAKAHDSVHLPLLWKVRERYGVPLIMRSILRQFHDTMRARVWMNDGDIGNGSTLEKTSDKDTFSHHYCSILLPRRCSCWPQQPSAITLIFREPGASPKARKRDISDRSIWDKPDVTTLVAIEEVWSLVSMPYADDTCIISWMSSDIENMMMIVTVCGEFEFTASEATVETTRLHS